MAERRLELGQVRTLRRLRSIIATPARAVTARVLLRSAPTTSTKGGTGMRMTKRGWQAAVVLTVMVVFLMVAALPHAASAASTSDIDTQATAALHRLYASNSAARHLGEKAKAVLVFPKVKKGGFLVGGLD